jgi:hypothetical protein
MAKRTNIANSLAKLAAAEEQFLRTQFLAPVWGDHAVQVRIAGVRCNMQAKPRDFCGWGVFRPENHREATFVREATLGERRRYLELFPSIPLILCLQEGKQFYAIAASRGDARVAATGLLPVHLAERAQPFDTVRAAFDGVRFWFDGPDARADPSVGRFLREGLADKRKPVDMIRAGMSPEQSAAYTLVFAMERQREIDEHERRIAAKKRTSRGRLSEALAHAGAALREFAELGDAYRVTFDLDGHRHTSLVRRDDLTVQTSGICLSGEDEKFDLHSLVSVLRESRGN